MEYFNNILATVGSVAAILSGWVTWIRTTADEREKLKQTLISLCSNSVKSLTVGVAFGAGLVNWWEVYQFGQMESAPSRKDILVLLMTGWNGMFYTFAALLVAALWAKQARDKKYPIHSQT
ncbi:hypothetical protein [Pseudomonas shirazensis]|uniref:hypothetical protein n=1 Tax=Pseudomonas shirazensis TaxID=2745494 RepID=UPI0016480F37|nr:hypothetical protein [Pseudomonas shirazensis]MBV4500755.1 hypothetical protein [Pseudomonas shirazensis]